MMILDRLGIKSIKIALAVMLSLVIGNLFKLDSPYLTAITAIIGIQSTVYDSVSNAKVRILGTSIGILMGIITVTLFSNSFIIVAIGVFIIIYVCNLLNLKSSILHASVIYLSIMLFPSPNHNAISIIISTIIGVIVTLIVNFTFSPFEINQNLYKSYNSVMKNIDELCRNLFTVPEQVKLKEFNSNIIAYKTLLRAYDNEYFKINDRRLDKNHMDILCENLNPISFFIYGVRELKGNNLNDCNVNRINSLLNLDISFKEHQESQSDSLLNFHVDVLLDHLERVFLCRS